MNSEDPGRSSSLWDKEPFATFRAEPKRFIIGLPVVFFAGAIAGVLLLRHSLQLAIITQLAVHTFGFVWLYVPVLLRNKDRL